MKKKNAILISMALAFLFLCSSASMNNTPEFLLTGGSSKNWKLTKETLRGNDITNIHYSPCQLDNIYTFSNDQSFIEKEGQTKCNAIDSDTMRIGTWILNSSKTQLIVRSNKDTLVFNINLLTSTLAIGTIADTTSGVFQNTFTAQ